MRAKASRFLQSTCLLTGVLIVVHHDTSFWSVSDSRNAQEKYGSCSGTEEGWNSVWVTTRCGSRLENGYVGRLNQVGLAWFDLVL